MGNSSARKVGYAILWIVAAAIAGLVVIYWLVRPQPLNSIMEETLAEHFQSESSLIIANIPSKRGRYPGAVVARAPDGTELAIRLVDSPDVPPGKPYTISGTRLLDRNAGLQLAGRILGGDLSGSGHVEITVTLKDARVYDKEAGALAKSLRDDPYITRLRQGKLKPQVVTRAYEAVPIINVRRSANAKVEDWAKVKDSMAKANGSVISESEVRFDSAVPQVIAYEVSDVKFLAENLSAGFTVKLNKSHGTLPGLLPSPQVVGAKENAGAFAFAVIASPQYSGTEFGDVPAASNSANIMRELLSASGGTEINLGLDPFAMLTGVRLKEAREKLLAHLREKPPHALVLYYIGHAVSGQSGANYLVLGDYTGKISKDLSETASFVPARTETHPLAGSNIDDLAKAVSAIGQELAASQPGLFSVADWHRELAEANVPFALLIDGCYPAKAMEELREQLRLTPWGDFYGDPAFTHANMQEYMRALRTFGEAPYLRSTNVVVFAAKPGTLASVTGNPLYQTDLLHEVGPLSGRYIGLYQAALERQENLTLGDWLRGGADFAGTGELDVKGSISWSDFSGLRSVPMMTFHESAPVSR